MARILIHLSHVICNKFYCASGSEVRINEVVFLKEGIEESGQRKVLDEKVKLTLGGSSYM